MPSRHQRREYVALSQTASGVEHQPVATGEAHLLLIEPRDTPNTGDAATTAPRRVI
jgi:hypothetical protein